MSIYRTLDSLFSGSLPDLCNVYVTLVGPVGIKQEGTPAERRHIPVRGLADSGQQAWLAVHTNPGGAVVQLPYGRTAPELIEMFTNPKLRTLFQPGEEALVQAVPRWGSDQGTGAVLYLNVQAILVLRPFFLIGRSFADWSHPCPRRTYLTATKATNRQQSAVHAGSIGGVVAHDAVLQMAVTRDRTSGVEDLLLSGVSADSLHALVLIGLTRRDLMTRALARAGESLEVIKGSVELLDLFTSTRWKVESDTLNNGIAVSPDLLGDAEVLELKTILESSEHFDPRKFRRQVESYLAWAMVEFGVDRVCRDWKGYLVHLSRQFSGDRIEEFSANLGLIAVRVRNRHEVLSLSSGRWLPRPEQATCNACEFAYPEDARPQLPPPCQHYCQAERSWDCVRPSPASDCPLLGRCNERHKFEAYERIDLFNALRDELSEEDEELAGVERTVAALAEAGEAGWLLRGLTFDGNVKGLMSLKLPEALVPLGIFTSGQEYVLLQEGRTLGRVRLHRRRGESTLLLSEERRFSSSLALGDRVDLRRTVQPRFPLREQLAYLDVLQRSGDEPISLRAGRARNTDLMVHSHETFESVPVDAQFVVIDMPNRRAVIEASDRVIRKHLDRGPSVIVGGEGLETVTSTKHAELSPETAATAIADRRGTLGDRLVGLVNDLAGATVRFVRREDVYEGSLQLWSDTRIDTIVIPHAETMPLLGLQRCLEVGPRRIVAIGQSLGQGPRTESIRAQGGDLHQNLIRFLIDAGRFALPPELSTMHIVRPRSLSVASGLERHLPLEGRRPVAVPTTVHVVTFPPQGPSPRGASLKLNARVLPTPASAVRRQIQLAAPGDQRIPLARANGLLKNVDPRSVERMSASLEGQLDTSILGFPATVERVKTLDPGSDAHEVQLTISSDAFRFVSEHARTNEAEANAVIESARTSGRTCIAVSPFMGQCLLLARLARSANVDLRVHSPQDLGNSKPPEDAYICLSMVADQQADGLFPYPISDTSVLVPVLLADTTEIRIFCSSAVAEHHPLIRRLPRA